MNPFKPCSAVLFQVVAVGLVLLVPVGAWFPDQATPREPAAKQDELKQAESPRDRSVSSFF